METAALAQVTDKVHDVEQTLAGNRDELCALLDFMLLDICLDMVAQDLIALESKGSKSY